jgi:hypothetical protein
MNTFWNFKIPFLIVVLCMLTIPCLGHDPIQIIGTGGSCFIGESGLDISEPVPDAGTEMGWWAVESEIGSSDPSKTIVVADPLNFYVDPDNFVGYTGNWYVLPGKTLGFTVIDPQLSLRIEDVTAGTDCTDGKIVKGHEIGFIINGNLYSADPGTPVSINMTGPAGNLNMTVLVTSASFHTGAVWDSKDLSGVYTIRAECNLNGMKDNYQISGQDIVGKTVSETRTITLVNPSDIGVFRSGQWILDYGIDGTVDRRFNYGLPTDTPLVGDFNNDGTMDIGVFRSGQWILDYGIDGTVDRRFFYGLPTDKPIVGYFHNDWETDIGVFRSGQWILDYGMDGTVDRRFNYGLPTDKPIVGYFNNDGITDIGVFRSGQWILDYGMDGVVDLRFNYGLPTDKPFVGFFNNDGKGDIGVFRSGQWILDYGMDGTVDRRFNYGLPTDIPIVGKLA